MRFDEAIFDDRIDSDGKRWDECRCDACLEDNYSDGLDEAREAEWPWCPDED